MDGPLAPGRPGRAAWLCLTVLLALAGCGRDQPGAPKPHTMRGRLVLIGQLVDGAGKFAGTRVVGDADGVAVELLYGTTVVARTTTEGGAYTFKGLLPGGYIARSFVNGPFGDHTEILTMTDADLTVGDTLHVASFGDFFPVPNPFAGETTVYFSLPDTERVNVAILSMAGDTVKTLLQGTRPQGLAQVRWDGTDRHGNPSTAPLVWITFRPLPDSLGNPPLPDYRAHLLFHQP